MKTFRTLAYSAGIALLTGCAAAPKPTMTDGDYIQIAGRWVGIQKCGQLGLLDPDSASRGMQYQVNIASLYTFDRPRLEALIRQYQGEFDPTPTMCNSAAMAIAGTKRQEAQSAAAAQASRQEWQDINNNRNKPTQTYCNKIGSQVLCNTY